MLGDAGELMHQCAPAYDSVVVYFHLSGNLGCIPDDDIVFHDTIVRYMRVSHDQAVISYNRLTFGGRSAINRHAFAYCGIITNFSGCDFSLTLQVLWDSGHYRTRENPAIFAPIL